MTLRFIFKNDAGGINKFVGNPLIHVRYSGNTTKRRLHGFCYDELCLSEILRHARTILIICTVLIAHVELVVVRWRLQTIDTLNSNRVPYDY